MKRYKIEQGTFDAPLEIVTNCTEKEFYKYLESLNAEINWRDNLTDEGLHMCFAGTLKNGIRRFIWVLRGKNEKVVLLHEICHYAVRVIYEKNLHLSEDNSENLAYLVEYTYREALKVFPKSKKR